MGLGIRQKDIKAVLHRFSNNIAFCLIGDGIKQIGMASKGFFRVF